LESATPRRTLNTFLFPQIIPTHNLTPNNIGGQTEQDS